MTVGGGACSTQQVTSPATCPAESVAFFKETQGTLSESFRRMIGVLESQVVCWLLMVSRMEMQSMRNTASTASAVVEHSVREGVGRERVVREGH